MARIIYSKNFDDQKKLLATIIAKHTADGTGSILTPYLAEQEINLTALATISNTAESYKVNHRLKMDEAEDKRRLRDNLFDPVFARLRGCVQYLKGLYRGRTSELGYWSITVNGDRIAYPNEFINRKNLVTAFYTYHQGLDLSPLSAYLSTKGIVATDEMEAADDAETANDALRLAEETAESYREDFENMWQPVMDTIRGIGMYLKNYHSGYEQHIYLWGFATDDSPQKPRLRTTRLLLGSHITINAVKIGSLLTNMSGTDLHVYKGETTSGAYTIVPAGQKMGILKGFSTITVVNPSTLEEAKFTVLTGGGRPS